MNFTVITDAELAPIRHCEERSDEVIQMLSLFSGLLATLAMTGTAVLFEGFSSNDNKLYIAQQD